MFRINMPKDRLTSRRTILLTILVVSAALRLFRLDFADGKPVFDERNYYVDAAKSYLENRDDPNFQHAPLGKELIALGILVFGDNPNGWRMPALVFSLGGILLVYLLARAIFGGKFVPLASSFLLSIDSLYFMYSRLAVLDMIMIAFVLLTLMFLWRVYSRGGIGNLLCLSVAFGLGIATKMTTLHLLPVMVTFLFFRYRKFPVIVGALSVIISIASCIYVASYIPFILRNSFSEFLVLQTTMIQFVKTWMRFGEVPSLTLETYFLSHAPSWVLNPLTGYYADPAGPGKISVVISHFNPVLLWGALGWGLWRFSKDPRGVFRKIFNDRRVLFLTLPITSNIFPWFFIRRVQYLYYALPSLPLLIVLLAGTLERSRWSNRDRVVLFFLVASAMFLYDYPLLTGIPVSPRLLNPLAESPLRLQIIEHGTVRNSVIPY